MSKLRKVLEFVKETVEKFGKLRNVLAFAEGAVKKMLANLEMCWNLLKELLKKCWQT